MSSSTPAPVLGPFWAKKVLSFYRRVRMEEDENIRQSDFQHMADRYIELGNLDGVKAKQVTRKALRLWDDFLAHAATNGEIHELDLIQGLRDRKDKLYEACILIFGLCFDLIDLNGDGVIQKEEYALFLKVANAHDEGNLERAFRAIDTDDDGHISHEEFIHAGCEYFMTDDESLPSTYMFGPLI